MSVFTNNRRLSPLVIGLILLNIILLTFLLFGHPRYGLAAKKGPPPERVNQLLQKELELSEEQLVEFKALREEHLTKVKKMNQAIRMNKKEMFDAMGSTDNLEVAKANARKIGEIQSERELELVMHYQKLQSICTETQKEKLKNVFERAMRKPKRKN